MIVVWELWGGCDSQQADEACHSIHAQPAAAFVPSLPVVARPLRLAPVAAASTTDAGRGTGPWGLGQLLNRFRGTSPRGATEASSITWTIDLVPDAKIEGEGGFGIHVSPLFSVGSFDFRLVAAASSRDDEQQQQPRLSLYLEHFPSSSASAAVPSVKCRLRWSHVPEEGQVEFEHTFDDPLASSMLTGKANLIPLPPAGAEVRVEATVALCGVHFPSPKERADMEAVAWERLLREIEALDGMGEEGMGGSESAGVQVEVEGLRLLDSEETN